MEYQYTQYKNLFIYATEWLKYSPESELEDVATFKKNMQIYQFSKLLFTNDSGKDVHIYLFSPDSKYMASQELDRLLTKIREPSDIILVVHTDLKTYSLRTINKHTHLKIKVYLQSYFNIIAPNGPLCSKHRIMSYDEVYKLFNNELFCYLTNLPKILVDDVQCIWIGAEVGDVLEITSPSDIVGSCVQYRVVIPRSGKIISFRDVPETVEVEDEIDKEIRENNEIDQNEIDQNESEPEDLEDLEDET
jgi:hypothetical protein